MALESSAQERLDLLTEAIAANMVADVCSIYLRRSNDRFELYSTEGLKKASVHKTQLDWGEGLVGQIAVTGQPLILTEAQDHPHFSHRPETGEENLHSFLGVPILRSGKTLGVLVIQNRTARQYTEEETEAVQTIATVLAEVVAAGDLLDEADTAVVGQLLLSHEVVDGMPIVAGVIIGHAALHEPPPPQHKTFSKNVADELKRLETALLDLQKNVDDMIASNAELSSVSMEVLEVYRLFAYDTGWARRLREK
ncbi:MAG: GAF domain-containing protein, partial [Parvularculaceae bacterium]